MRYPAARMIKLSDTRRAREYRASRGTAGLRLSAGQFEIVSTAARALPVEKRDAFLQRVAGLLRQRTGKANDADVAAVAQQALSGLIQQVA